MSRGTIERVLRAAGHDVEIIDRKDPAWKEALSTHTDAVVAAGGDGTVQHVIQEFAGKDVPIAILPIGTANNIAHSLGYTIGDPLEERVSNWPVRERRIELASAARDGWEARFIESVGVGAFAEMVSDDDEADSQSHHTAVALTRMRQALIEKLIDTTPVAVELDIDGQTVAGDYLLAEVLNLRFIGPRLMLAADPLDPAMFTVCAVHASQRDAAAHWIAVGTGDPRRFELGRGRVVRMRTEAPIHADGKVVEPALTGEVRLEVGARTARLWV
jgi:diacylglycerol kinase (ATP)